MTRTAANDDLLAVLTAFVEGGDRRIAIERIAELLPLASGSAWVRELQYVLRHYSETDPATEKALLAVARHAITRFPCPACEQMVLDEPAWHASGPSDEVCPSCGIQFGYDDADPARWQRRFRLWREQWLANGRRPVRPSPPPAEAAPD